MVGFGSIKVLDYEQCALSKEVNEHFQITTKNSYKEYSGGKENRTLLLTHIREAIKGKLEAIILYNNFINDIK